MLYHQFTARIVQYIDNQRHIRLKGIESRDFLEIQPRYYCTAGSNPNLILYFIYIYKKFVYHIIHVTLSLLDYCVPVS